MVSKSEIFHKPAPREIIKGRSSVHVENKLRKILETIKSINPKKESVVIQGDLIPDYFFYSNREMIWRRSTRTQASRKFMKHGHEVKFPRFKNVDGALRAMSDQRKVPMHLREHKFDHTKGYVAAYSFTPIIGNDRRKRKVHITELIDGAELFAYASRNRLIEIISSYSDSERVAIDGGEMIIRMPSRTPKREKYEFKITGFPLVDNDLKYVLANTVISTHSCPDMAFRIRYRYINDKENSRVFNWCAHDIAGWPIVTDYFWNEEGNITPLAMSQIPLPSQELASFGDSLRHDVVIFTKEDFAQDKRKIYPLNNAEREILCSEYVQRRGHNATLVSKLSRDGLLKDYSWRGM